MWSSYISSVDRTVHPMASACCFPSAMIACQIYKFFFTKLTMWWWKNLWLTTMVPLGQGVILAPGEVNPGHIMLAPLSTKRMAPLSTCCHGKTYGSNRNSDSYISYCVRCEFVYICAKDGEWVSIVPLVVWRKDIHQCCSPESQCARD